jgi:DNA-binding beta-propeller fold protein YncE
MPTTSLRSHLVHMATVAFLSVPAMTEASFVNFESGHTRPLALSPDGSLLFAVNTPNNSLSIFEVDGSGLTLAAQIPVGLEPVAVASRTNTSTAKTEAWVVNHLSDSVSVVEIDAGNLAASRVRNTLLVGDEPRDIVFGGSPVAKAFITTARRGQNLPASFDPRFFEEGIPRALVWAFNAQSVGAGLGGTPVAILELFGDSPRALAVTPDGSTVYAAVFHSGNGTTPVADFQVAAQGGSPPLPSDSPFFGMPGVQDRGLIVKHDPVTGEWNDELGRDFTSAMNFSLPDKDVFAIDADANPPVPRAVIDSYTGVGTTLFNMAVRPGTGSVFVANTDARNHVRFEPVEAGGVQGRAAEQRITVLAGMTSTPVPVNPHIDYGVATGPPAEIAQSVAGLGDLVFSGDGATLFAAALGSNQVAVFDAAALEAGTVTRDLVDVGAGPSGVALDEAQDRLYVLNHFDHSISIVTDASDPLLRAESATVSLGYDPTPAVIREGRPFLYDARSSSGHGDQACASCHPFGDADQLLWDLGDPYGSFVDNPNPFEQVSTLGPIALMQFTPLKGPILTQSLRGLDDAGPMHWRGDRTAADDPGGDAMDEDGAFKKFNAAFVDLLGRPAPLTASEMQAFTDFVLTIRYPPNPNAALDGELSDAQQAGFEVFTTNPDSLLETTCAACHALPLGTGRLSSNEGGTMLKVPHLRALYQKVGMFGDEVDDLSFKGDQVRGSGYGHQGGVTTLVEFVASFDLQGLKPGYQPAEDVANFLLAFDTGLSPAVGQQVTLGASPTADQQQRLALLLERSVEGDCDLTFAGRIDGAQALAAVLPNGHLQLDDSTAAALDDEAIAAFASAPGGEQTWTCRPPGTGLAMTIDRDGDGVLNADELREGTDPFDSGSVPYECTGSAEIAAAKMAITKNESPEGDERFTLKASWLEPSFSVDPVADGLTLVLRDADGIAVHHSLPASGWATSNGEKWAFGGPDGAVVGKAKLSVRDGEYKLTVKGRGGDFRVATATPELVLMFGGDAAATAGECLSRAFGVGPVPACELFAKKLKCS